MFYLEKVRDEFDQARLYSTAPLSSDERFALNRVKELLEGASERLDDAVQVQLYGEPDEEEPTDAPPPRPDLLFDKHAFERFVEEIRDASTAAADGSGLTWEAAYDEAVRRVGGSAYSSFERFKKGREARARRAKRKKGREGVDDAD